MSSRMSSRWAIVWIAAVALSAGCTARSPSTTTTATPPPASSATSVDTPASSATPSPSPSAVVPADADPVSLQAPRDGSFLVRGEYPRVGSSCRRAEQPVLRARYPGRLTVERADDGTLTVLVTLPFERYLEGIAEVPTSWPRAALEAQAIAARTYALATTGWTGEGATLGSPICSTASCQVYRGLPVPPEPGIGRWVAAVRRTAGTMLIHEGRPAQTLYFSTSNGRTYGNEDVFGSDPLPYLRPVVERDDGSSPTSRWRTEVPFAELTTILDGADLWPGRTGIRRVVVGDGVVRVIGAGTRRTFAPSELRDALNVWAPCLLPGRYPPAVSGSTLPITVPSIWFTASVARGALVFDGRGWGHGVGMVQWGAYGKATRGLSAAQILATYYGGLMPRRFPEPDVIDVEVASGLTSLRVVPSRDGARIDGEPLGRGPITISRS